MMSLWVYAHVQHVTSNTILCWFTQTHGSRMLSFFCLMIQSVSSLNRDLTRHNSSLSTISLHDNDGSNRSGLWLRNILNLQLCDRIQTLSSLHESYVLQAHPPPPRPLQLCCSVSPVAVADMAEVSVRWARNTSLQSNWMKGWMVQIMVGQQWHFFFSSEDQILCVIQIMLTFLQNVSCLTPITCTWADFTSGGKRYWRDNSERWLPNQRTLFETAVTFL